MNLLYIINCDLHNNFLIQNHEIAYRGREGT